MSQDSEKKTDRLPFTRLEKLTFAFAMVIAGSALWQAGSVLLEAALIN